MSKNLNLGGVAGNIGLGTSERLDVQKRWDTHAEAEHRATQNGAGGYHVPTSFSNEGFVMLTSEMLNVTQQSEYSKHFTYYLSWFTYFSELVADLDSKIMQFRNMKSIIYARTREHHRHQPVPGKISARGEPKYPSIEDVNSKIELDPQYQEVKLQLQELEQERTIVVVKRDAAEQCMKVVSRNIEAKRVELEMNRLEGNHTRRPDDISSLPHASRAPVLSPVRHE